MCSFVLQDPSFLSRVAVRDATIQNQRAGTERSGYVNNGLVYIPVYSITEACYNTIIYQDTIILIPTRPSRFSRVNHPFSMRITGS
jgi:hypothetical protein